MRTIDRILEKQCWMDVFESNHFTGRMRRIYGPVQFKSISAGSVIVGPEARVEVYGRSNGQPFKMRLEPKRLVVDLAAVLKGAKIGSAMVSCDLSAVRPKNMPGTKPQKRMANAQA